MKRELKSLMLASGLFLFLFSFERVLAALKIEDFCSRTLSFDPSIKYQPGEIRGLISVPIDYNTPLGPTLNIVYRKFAPTGDTFEASSKPILFLVNGGPGYPSSTYRSYEFSEDGDPLVNQRLTNRLSVLLQNFRVVLFDQRGTEGLSSRLMMNRVGKDYELVAQFFGSRETALDADAVISQIVKPGEEYYVIFQSYGGMVGSKFVTDSRITSNPTGVIFSSSVMPHYQNSGVNGFFKARRLMQRDLNLKLKLAVPGVISKIDNLRAHLSSLGLNPKIIHRLFSLLGRGQDGEWELKLSAQIDVLSRATEKAEIYSALVGMTGLPEPLNYVLSSTEMTPGTTDRLIAKELIAEVPFESWMLDEQMALLDVDDAPVWFQQLMDYTDSRPPALPRVPSEDEMRQGFARRPVLMTFADQDGLVPPTLMEQAREIYGGSSVHIELLKGGHGAITTDEGATAILNWIANLKKQNVKRSN